MASPFRLTLVVSQLLAVAATSVHVRRDAPRTDPHGDPLPACAIQRLGTLRYCQYDCSINGLAFAADGKTYATAANTEKVPTVRLWHTATGQEFLRLPGATSEAILHIAFAPDGKTVAASTTNDLVVWDLATGKQFRRFVVPEHFVHCFAWSPDGKTLALGCQRPTDDPLYTVRLLDADSGKLVREIRAHETHITAVAFSPDGKRLASSSDDRWLASGRSLVGDVRLWDVATGKLLRRLARGLPQRRDWLRDRSPVSFARDLDRVAFRNQDDRLEVWDLDVGTRLGAVADLPKTATFALTPDGRQLVTCAGGEPAALWDAESGRQLRVFPGRLALDHNAPVIDPTGKYLAVVADSFGGESNRVRLWDLAGGRALTGDAGHQDTLTFTQATPEGGHALTAARDGTLRFWETRAGKPLWIRASYLGRPGTVALAADGTTAVAVTDSWALHRLELPAGKAQVLAKWKPGQVSHVALSADGRTVAVCLDREPVVLLDAASGNVLASLEVVARQAGFAPDGQTLVTMNRQGPERFTLWQVRTARPLLALTGPAGWAQVAPGDLDAVLYQRVFAFSSDGRWFAVSQSEMGFAERQKGWARTQVFLWELASGRLVRTWDGLSSDAEQIAFLPGGCVLALGARPGDRLNGAEHAACFWDLADGRFLGRLEGHPGIVSTVAVSPSGLLVLTGAVDHTVLVWGARALPRPKVGTAPLTERRLVGLWEDLADADARRAFDALLTLRGGGREVIAFLQNRLRPVAPRTAAEREELAQLVADLDDGRYAVRARASSLLENYGEFAVPVLCQVLKPGISVEMRQRVEVLLAKLDRFPPPAAQLRAWRALAVLEYAGTPQARAVLEALAAGAPEARLTQQARAALERLKRASS
jgi:WD40 repeat protein